MQSVCLLMSSLLPYLFLYCCIHLDIACFFSLLSAQKPACMWGSWPYCHSVNFYLEFLHKVWDPFSFAVLLWHSLFTAMTAVCIQNSLLKDLMNPPDILHSLVLNINWVNIVKCLQSISWNYIVSFSTFRQSHSIDLDFSSWKTVELSFFPDIFFYCDGHY